MYHNDPKLLDRQVGANSVNPNQTAVLSGSTPFAIPYATFGPITLQ